MPFSFNIFFFFRISFMELKNNILIFFFFTCCCYQVHIYICFAHSFELLQFLYQMCMCRFFFVHLFLSRVVAVAVFVWLKTIFYANKYHCQTIIFIFYFMIFYTIIDLYTYILNLRFFFFTYHKNHKNVFFLTTFFSCLLLFSFLFLSVAHFLAFCCVTNKKKWKLSCPKKYMIE